MGCRVILLRALPDMPRNDWTEEIAVGRVTDVEHDIRRQPPRSIIRVIAHDTKSSQGGFRAFTTSEIVRVVGELGATEARQSVREQRVEEREERRAERRRKRLARRKRD